MSGLVIESRFSVREGYAVSSGDTDQPVGENGVLLQHVGEKKDCKNGRYYIII